MRVTLLSAVLVAAGLAFAVPSSGQTLIPPGGAGDSTEKKQPEMQEVKDAAAFFQNRDVDNALKKLEEAAKKNTDQPPAEVKLADWFFQVKSYPGMWGYLDKATQKYPDDPEAFVMLGEIALNQSRLTEADMLFNKAYSVIAKFNKSADRLAKLKPRILRGMSIVAESREDWPLAQQRYEEYLKLEPKNVIVMQRIGRVLFKQNKTKESLEKFREATKVPDTEVLPAEAQLAILYMQYPDPEQAKTFIAEALKKNPKDTATHLEAAKIYLQTGDLEEAKKQCTEALKLDPKSLNARMLSGFIAMFQKDYQSAVSVFEQVAIDSPKNFEATDNLALALIESKEDAKKKRALDYAEQNVKNTDKTDNSPEAVSTYAWVLYRMDPKNLDQADKIMRQVIGAGRFNPDTAYYAAVIFTAKERPEEAKGLLKEAMKNTGPWTMKTEAKKLLEQLSK
jgi:tetratricopeptide (TPR) repeat protein